MEMSGLHLSKEPMRTAVKTKDGIPFFWNFRLRIL